MKLWDIAHSRTGDKGNISNLSLIAYDKKDYAMLAEKTTAYDDLDYDFLAKTLDISAISFHKTIQVARKKDAIFPDMSIQDNVTMSILKKISKWGFINRKKQAEIINEYIGRLKIKTPNARQLIKFLSGGNQQKCIIARGLCADPDIIILDEPTRGIDVGAKMEIELLIQQLAKQNISVVMISSILEELVRDCDRVIIIREGEVVGELSREEITEESIIHRISEAHAI